MSAAAAFQPEIRTHPQNLPLKTATRMFLSHPDLIANLILVLCHILPSFPFSLLPPGIPVQSDVLHYLLLYMSTVSLLLHRTELPPLYHKRNVPLKMPETTGMPRHFQRLS